ncbi:sulfurtransferase TusA family protein [Mangrovicoccus sp. HB161399]|uniref:sulfurtransferase TusA family protein n=1 Tax=Mangrovicoccus sp. HB161399 TaxID=2720392 RepID=UPI0015569948|nr:sulfurtransferase TusA family protein [Mangrovicoccus sp. HB161399]
MTALPVPDLTIDAIGLRCPLPVLRARKRLEALAPGQVLCLLADDPMAAIDLPHFCHEAGHVFLSAEETPDGLRLLLRKGAPGPG